MDSRLGAFVLYTLRMMMFDGRTGDGAFKGMMHDFVKTYTNRAAMTSENKVPLGKGPKPKRFMINYYYDVLAQQ